jgi:hypothetical protein
VTLPNFRLDDKTALVTGAGIANAAPAEEMSARQWQHAIGVNLTGVSLQPQPRHGMVRPRPASQLDQSWLHGDTDEHPARGRRAGAPGVDLVVDGGFTCW